MGISSKGNFGKTTSFLTKLHRGDIYSDLEQFGQMGVTLLSQATPSESGETANSWGYRIIRKPSRVRIEWYNTNVDEQGTPVAVLIQYGHATGTGGFVEGRDYINPVIRPLFDQIANDVWKKVNHG